MLELQTRLAFSDTLSDVLSCYEKPLFFDIETTGLSARNASIYLIGVVFYDGTYWNCRQWFAERLSDEAGILQAFFAFTKEYRTLVHFNGTTFDIPFITACTKQSHIPCPLHGLDSLDLLLCLKPYQKLLGTERMNQKTLEQRLGLDREDPYSGGELIAVYQAYLDTPTEEARQSLLLHNAEDLRGMLTVATALRYERFLLAPFSLTEQTHTEDCILLTCTCREPICVPAPADFTATDGFSLSMEGNRLRLSIPCQVTQRKLFFPDWKNYYYLPDEDKAIHRSVGEYVDPAFRVKATAATCYQSFSGTYLPQFKPLLQPSFYEEYNGKQAYLRLESSPLSEEGNLQTYLRALLSHYVSRKLLP